MSIISKQVKKLQLSDEIMTADQISENFMPLSGGTFAGDIAISCGYGISACHLSNFQFEDTNLDKKFDDTFGNINDVLRVILGE